jgi:peptidoglycan/LPS O-acetylase OafA/YrhL
MSPVTTGQVVAHLFYLQECLGYREINPVFWTLCQEVQFYIVYGLLLALARYDSSTSIENYRTRFVLAGAATVSLLWPLGILTSEPWPGSFLPLWNGFIVGAGAYWAWRRPMVTPYYMIYVVILVCAALCRSNSMSLICAMTSVGLWAAAVTGNIFTGLRWRWLQTLGLVSYSLYLTHNPITGATFRVGYMMTGRSIVLEVVWWVVATAVCVLFAWAVWWLIERPSMKLARRIRLDSSSIRQSMSARPSG